MSDLSTICTVRVEYVLEDPSTEVRKTEVIYEFEQEPQTSFIDLPIFAVALSICTASSTHVPDTHRIFTNPDGTWVCHGTKGDILRVDRPPSKRFPATTRVAIRVKDETSTLDTLRVVVTSKAEVSKNKGEILFRPVMHRGSVAPEANFTGKVHLNSSAKATSKSAQKTLTNPKSRSSYLPVRDAITAPTSSTAPSSTTSRNRISSKTSVAPAPSVPLRDAKDPPRWAFGRSTTSTTSGAKAATLVNSLSESAPHAVPIVKIVSVEPKESTVAKSRSTPATASVKYVCEQCGQTFVRPESLKRHQATALNCTVKKKRNSVGRVILGSEF